MLLLISPAKTLDFSPQSLVAESTKPPFLKQSKQLIALLREYSPKQLSKLMNVSDKLAAEVHSYVDSWKAKYNCANAKQALLAFRGDVYQGINADTFSAADFEFVQRHLRILSGLYGVLRPLDLIQTYRLEMGCKLPGEHGKNLYDFWGDRIAQELEKALAGQGDDLLINLASNEYFKAARAESLPCRIVTPVFKDLKRGQYRVVSFFAKQARGMMVSHIVRKQIADLAGIRKFRSAGYRYNRELSTEDSPVFTRDNPNGSRGTFD